MEWDSVSCPGQTLLKHEVHTISLKLGDDVSHYLITGGAGFIGSNLVASLVAQHEQVRVAK